MKEGPIEILEIKDFIFSENSSYIGDIHWEHYLLEL